MEIGHHDDYVSSVAVSKDNKFVVSGSKDRTVKLWGLENDSGSKEIG